MIHNPYAVPYTVRMPTRIERLEQQTQALELRLQGHSIRAIAARMGVTHGAAQRRVAAALKSMPTETTDEVRRTVETRYDALLARMYALLETGRLSPMEQVQTANAIVNVENARVRLLGLSVPSAHVIGLQQVVQEHKPSADFLRIFNGH
jgi:hypothetical protein